MGDLKANHWTVWTLMQELRGQDVAGFLNFVRMEPAMFRELLERLSLIITKQDTFYMYS